MVNNNRGRAWRRAQAEKKSEKRTKMWANRGWHLDERRRGMARKSHFGCGCAMCKPWKYGKKI